MNKPPTMTLHECCEALRANQVKVSERLFGQMIQEGRLPFAVGTRAEDSSRAAFIIFRAGFYSWLDEMLQQPAIRY